ncbi:M48 family metallopeptidase [Dysgonomonas sp. 520]|uniref:M48 family metallopeptidase n=1 Tax=Dysgonomonas sp. 520 TaxID=2302931 RepID=UPI0013D5F941|nr:M48 family metallopeptidase [Dysgonomonas sp. 520]NDW09875.1 M48 family peptidase [Dysgonomonas sp. 520]
MKYSVITLIVALSFILSGCGSVPITGRKQMLLVSDQEVLTLSLQQYDEFIKTAPLSTDKANTALVVKVGKNIAAAVETYMRANGYESELASYSWEFHLVKSTDVNAFCMPGGKIVVYEGILPVTRDETGLAVVLGHEVAHAVAKHSNERMSQQVAAQYGGAALGAVLSGTSSTVQNLAGAVYGLGAEYGVMLPYSRKQELEADKLGLIFMAMAGYNPSFAKGFWERMSQASGGGVPEFMSTHPSDATRINQIDKDLSDALKYYKGGNTKTSNSSGSKTSDKWSF